MNKIIKAYKIVTLMIILVFFSTSCLTYDDFYKIKKENESLKIENSILKSKNYYTHIKNNSNYDCFIQLYNPIIHLVKDHFINDEFIKIVKEKDKNINVKGFGTYIENFYTSESYNLMNNNFLIISFIKESEEKAKLFRIITNVYSEDIEKLNNRINKNLSIIYFKNRGLHNPIVLLGAENEENIKKVYNYILKMKEIKEGYIEIHH